MLFRAAVGIVHTLHKIRRSEEHAAKALLDLPVADPYPLAEHQDLEIFPDSPLAFTPPHDQVVFHQNNIDLFSEGVILEGGIRELFKAVNHSGPFGVAVDVPYTGQVVFIGVDDARSITIPPQVSGSPDMFVVPHGYSGVEILHGSMEVFFCSGGDDMVVVGHEDDVVNEKVIFFMGFLKGLKDDACDLALVEPECPVVCPADQVVR